MLFPARAQEMIFYNQSLNNKVILYEGPEYSGQSKELAAGIHRFTTPADFNDLASSIKVPAGFVAVIFEHVNQSGGYGNYVDLMEDCANLSIYDFNDKVSYLNIFSATARPGYVYVRNRMTNNQFVAGHWERERAGATKPDNSLPAVTSSLQATHEVVASLKNAPAFEDIPVFRLQLRITTGSGTDAGTDDPVYTQLNKNDKRFYLVKGYDNFIEGRPVIYDVISENIKTIKDIEFLRFGIKGDDGVCFKKVELILNNYRGPVFTKIWEGGKGNCFDNGSSSLLPIIEISGLELRNSPYWKYIVTNPSNVALCWPPTSISKEWITSVVEAAIGNNLQYMEGLKWGTKGTITTLWGDAVESKGLNDHSIQFDLDLQADVIGPNSEIDVDFELDFHCINGVLSTEVQNFHTTKFAIGRLASFLSGPAFIFLDEVLRKVFIDVKPDGTVVAGACSNIFVTPQGEIKLR